jgi:hypothetical protein
MSRPAAPCKMLKVCDGIVAEIGIANKALTTGRAAQWRFLNTV